MDLLSVRTAGYPIDQAMSANCPPEQLDLPKLSTRTVGHPIDHAKGINYPLEHLNLPLTRPKVKNSRPEQMDLSLILHWYLPSTRTIESGPPE